MKTRGAAVLALAAVAGIGIPFAVAQTQSADGERVVASPDFVPPELVETETRDGTRQLPDLSDTVQMAKLEFLGAAEGMQFLRGPSIPGLVKPGKGVSQCFVLVHSNNEAQVGCANPGEELVGPSYMNSELPGGRVEGAIFTTAGTTELLIDGRSVPMTDGGVAPVVSSAELPAAAEITEVRSDGSRETVRG